MKVKLIEILNMIENETLDDNERVIIDNNLYHYNQEDKKLYTAPSSKWQNAYRTICTNELDLECDLIDRNIIITDIKIPKSTEEIEELGWVEIGNESGMIRVPSNEELRTKINELVREVNCLKRNE